MASKAEAEEALYGAIVAAAKGAEESKDGDLLKSSAEAFREVAHGPQGGSYEDERRYEATHSNTNETTTRTTTDFHETHHPDSDPKAAPGFGSR